MLYSLSCNVIADTVHALAALEVLGGAAGGLSKLPPLLDPDRRGQLRLLIRNSFAETVMSLLPFVEDAEIDSEKAASAIAHQEPAPDGADPLMQISLRLPASLPVSDGSASFHGLLRRRLETAVVKRVLAALAPTAEDRDAALRDCRDSERLLLAMLSGPPAPFLRRI